MLSTRHWLVTTILFAVLGVSTNGGTAMGQDVFNGDGVAGTAPDDPDNPSTPPALIPLDGNGGGNWEGSYPGNGSQELDEGISIELNEEDETLSWFEINFIESLDWTEVDNLLLESNSQVLFTTTGADVAFTFSEVGARVSTGSGAMWFDGGFQFNANGDLAFDYGDGGNEDALLIEYDEGAASGLEFNLIIEGAIGDNDSPQSGTLTFKGGGWALLTGGTDFANVDSEFALALEEGASLMMGGAGEAYIFDDGLTIAYSGGQEGRSNGKGILQIVDGANVTTNSADTAISGSGSLLVGAIDLDSLAGDLNFDEHVADSSGGASAGTYTTETLELTQNAAVVVGASSSLTANQTTVEESSDILVQSAGTASLGTLEMSGGTIVNQSGGNLNAISGVIQGGLFRSYGATSFDGGITVETSTFDVLGGVTGVGGNATFNNGASVLISGGTLNLQGAENAFNNTITIENAGILRSGVEQDGYLTTLNSLTKILIDGEGSRMTVAGDLDSSGVIAVSDGGRFDAFRENPVDPLDPGAPEGGDILNQGSATYAGGSSEGYSGEATALDFTAFNFEAGNNLAMGSLISGVYDSNSGAFGANYGTLDIWLANDVDLDLTQAESVFYVSNGQGNSQPYVDILSYLDDEIPGGDSASGNSNVIFGENSTISLGISADEDYIASGTVFTLFNPDDIEGNSWDLVSFSGYNTVTRSFEAGQEPGTVTITADYIAPAEGGSSVVQQRGVWLQEQSENLDATDLLVLLDQIGTVGQYQNAVGRLGPESVASGLQVVSDTNAFNAYHEALSDMRTGNELGRPGPARRPLSQSSQSLLASQDEGDTIRSQYGYGSGPASGERRQEDDNMVAFVQGYYRTINLDNMSNVIGVNGNQWGVVAGVGGQLSQNSVLGLLVGYDDFTGDLNDNYGSVDVGTVRAGPFFGWADENWNVDLALTGGYNDWNGTRRNTALPGAPSYNWSTGGWQMDFSSGLGYRIPLGGGVNLVPEGSFVYSFIQTDSYTEQGNKPGTLQVDTNDLNSVIGRVGASVEVISIAGLILEGRLGWQGNYSFGGDLETGVLGGGSPLPGTPDQVDRNNVYYGGQITWMPTWDVSLSFRYEGRSLDGTNDQYFGGGVSFEF
jgi:hypothetical protein